MKSEQTGWIIIVLLLLFTFSCTQREAEDTSPVVAQINGHVLTEDMLLEFSGVTQLNDLSETDKRKKIDEWMKIILLAQEADNRGLTDDSRIRSRIQLAEKSIKANLMLSALFRDISPTETELFNYYQIHKGRYLQDREEYRIQRILFNSEATADSVSRLIVNGETNFAEAARNYSREQARETDGYLGYLTIEEMDEPTLRAINNLSQWRYIKVRGDRGFYLIRYTEQRNRRVEKSFTEVMDEIEEEYISEIKNEYIENVIDELMNRSDLIISQ